LVACAVAALVDYHFWQRTWWIWFALSLVGLTLCFLPPFRHKINGSWRWLEFQGFTCQPSEFAKMAAVFFLAFWFSRYETESNRLWRGFVLPMAIVSLLVSLIITEVDLGTTILIGATTFVVMFIAGTNLALLGALSLGGIASILYLAAHIAERNGRSWPSPPGAIQADRRLAANAGADRLGAAESMALVSATAAKMSYLPYAHTDFIFPIVGEELGLRSV
jgi:cell division protein FtsW